MNRLPTDIKNCVFGFLNVVDIIGFTHVNKYHHSFNNINIINIFESRLLKVMMRICQVSLIDARKFLELISKYNGFISGSTILQVLYGNDYDNSDLDIYFRHHEKDIKILQCNRTDIISIINPNYISKSSILTTYFKPYEEDEHVIWTTQCGMPSYSRVSDFTILYNYKTDDNETPTIYKNVQLIEVSTQKFLPDLQSITGSYDLSIVCNIYNPHKKILEVFSLPKLVSRTSHQFKVYIASIRIKKYQDRGINIKNISKYESLAYLKKKINSEISYYHEESKYNWD